MFDPEDHAGAPAEAPYGPGQPPWCRRCGGLGWYYHDEAALYGDPVSCHRCDGTGEEPGFKPAWGRILMLVALFTFWLGVAMAIRQCVEPPT